MTSDNTRKRGQRTDDGLTKLSDGRWRGRPTLGTDPVTGKQVRPYKTFLTKGAARDWITDQRKQWDARTWAAKSERTFDDVADHWLKVREADDGTRENTIRADRESLAYSRRAFGSVSVQKLTPRGTYRLVAQPDD